MKEFIGMLYRNAFFRFLSMGDGIVISFYFGVPGAFITTCYRYPLIYHLLYSCLSLDADLELEIDSYTLLTVFIKLLDTDMKICKCSV